MALLRMAAVSPDLDWPVVSPRGQRFLATFGDQRKR